MASGWSSLSGWTDTNGETLPLSILLHCRTVVESDSLVATGLMTQVDGEWFEVEINEFEGFKLGEKVKLTVYSPAGILTFYSSVFAKYEGAIAVIQPPEVKKRYEEKRGQPRVEAEGSVRMLGGTDQAGQALVFSNPLEAVLRNISISGIGFIGPDLPVLHRNARLKAIVTISDRIGFDCELDIVRREPRADGVEVGATITLPEPALMRSLRAFILQRQVELKVQMRRSVSRSIR